MTQVTVTSLRIYPVKSMKAIDVPEAKLTAQGLQHDRRWMVVRQNGRFVTQRDINQLALIHTELAENGIRLTLPGHGSITVPWDAGGGPQISTMVWKDACETESAGAEVSEWLTAALESRDPLHLVRMVDGFTRQLAHPETYGAGTFTYFADAAPFLLANESSLDALNQELAQRGLQQVPMNRFRPSIVVKGLPAFAEHGVDRLEGDDYALQVRQPCERCVVTTINQDTAERSREQQPFKTLRDLNPMPGNPRAPAFAENTTLLRGAGNRIAVGDRLDVVLKNPA